MSKSVSIRTGLVLEQVVWFGNIIVKVVWFTNKAQILDLVCKHGHQKILI